jgi:nucleotide-binding universal stress UspA family protein
MKILVPTDFSLPSKKAVKYATYLAGKLQADLYIFHALPLHSVWMENEEKKSELTAEKKLNQVVDGVRKEVPASVKVESFVVRRFPLNDVVNEIVAKLKIDFIVMGTLGASSRSDKLLGSFASGMIRHSTVPVIAVPDENKKKDIRKIVLPTDLNDIADEVREVVRYAKKFDAAVHVIYVPPAKGNGQLPLSLSKLTSYKNIHFHEVKGKSAESAIEKFVKDHDADLIAMFTKKRSILSRIFNPSLTEKLSFTIEVPLFAFHKG